MKTQTNLSTAAGLQMIADMIEALLTAKNYLPKQHDKIEQLLEKLNSFTADQEDILAARGVIYDSLLIQSQTVMSDAEKLVNLKKDYDRDEKQLQDSLHQVEEIMKDLKSLSDAKRLEKAVKENH